MRRIKARIQRIACLTLLLFFLSDEALSESLQGVNVEQQRPPTEGPEDDQSPRRLLFGVGLGLGHPGVGAFASLDLRTIDQFYLGGIAAGAIGDHVALFVGGRAQYRFALPSDLHLGVLAGAGWLDGETMGFEYGSTSFDDGIMPLFGGTFAYQPSWFMVGADLMVVPATLTKRDGIYVDNPEPPRHQSSAFLQLSVVVGLAL